jgi:predicted Fe-Mo cluster-binding NifX family protein
MHNYIKIAIPIVNDLMTIHFGQCEKFAIVIIEEGQILRIDFKDPPVHENGAYPIFLAKMGVNVVISGGMGLNARKLFSRHNIEVYFGVLNESPRILVEKYLLHQLQGGQNMCDHNNKLHQCSGKPSSRCL